MITGRGIFATKVFFKGDFILEYRGTRVTHEPPVSETYLYEFIHNGKRMWYVFFYTKYDLCKSLS